MKNQIFLFVVALLWLIAAFGAALRNHVAVFGFCLFMALGLAVLLAVQKVPCIHEKQPGACFKPVGIEEDGFLVVECFICYQRKEVLKPDPPPPPPPKGRAA